MERTGVEHKRWLSSRDAYVRPSHRALDGQIVPADQPFRGGGIEGMHPGSMSGGAASNARCRCLSIALPDEKAVQDTDTEAKRTAVWQSTIDEAIEFEKRLMTAARAGFQKQERALVVAAYRRYAQIG
jgi:uncharacterized protein with gpF-like domain